MRLQMIRECEQMLGDRVEGDALICDERRNPFLVRLAQVIAAESVGCFLETVSQISLAQAWRNASLPRLA